MTTILDIAKMANVSKSTVSRVINGQPGVSQKSKNKVLEVINQTNFLPNKAARTLKSSDSNSILILFHRPSKVTVKNPFYLEIVSEISVILESYGYDIILQTYLETVSEIESTKSKIANQLVKGIIILSSPLDETFFKELDKLSIPTIIVGKITNTYKNIYSVDTDNYRDSYRLVECLVNFGHQNIVCIHPPADVNVSKDRVSGYLDCLKDNHLQVDKNNIVETGYTINQTLKDIDYLFRSKLDFSAIFATDIIRALCVYKKANEYNLRIPDDLSIICFSSDVYSPFFFPEPSGIEIPIFELAKSVSQQLLKLINKENMTCHTEIIDTKFTLTNSIKKI
ncbi:LacI family DNA-binding transcriptional regulator [Streptococcus parauberis]|uniref:LacI family DNA-binding transcriptional regulator n=1 Tax=Streptococcus parauberis TaxID=1348 RepID=UPI000C1C970C|nr:LacI family DNA-binding transcriptional regulator [Streptococcus parauberis]PIO79417.1 Catabolite control protein A [Streptococcus parauberis]POS67529.1 Catabolite control protein A [Streptococcus parauberis]